MDKALGSLLLWSESTGCGGPATPPRSFALFPEMEMALAQLGLSVDQERLYRVLLRHHSVGLEQDGSELALPHVNAVAAELGALGLLGWELRPVAPTTAVHLLAQVRLERAWRDLRDLASVGGVLADI